MRFCLISSFITLQLLVTGCIRVGPDYCCPRPCMPDRWHQEIVSGLDDCDYPVQSWWTLFNDPMLEYLIERAEYSNLSLKEACYRIQEARALRGIATGEWYPDVNSTGFAKRERSSKEFPPPKPTSGFINNFLRVATLDASWEIDFWGRISRLVESTTANLQASVEDYRDVLVLLYAEVASTYTEVRTLQERIRYAEANVKSQQGSLAIAQARFKAELTSELDVFQAELNLASTEANIPTLRAGLTEAINRLGVLLGEYPEALHDELRGRGAMLEPPMNVTVGLPANLLRQRPEIRRAEREYAAQFALIGAATADLYPQFSLTGELGYFGTKDIFESSKRIWNYAGNYFWNLFDGGRVRNNIRVEVAKANQSKKRYEQALLTAVEDVENAMSAYVEELIREKMLQDSVDAAQKSVDLVQYQYRTGLVSFDVVLDLERSLFQQQDLLVESQGLVVQNLIRLYKALGGGWCEDKCRKEICFVD